MPIFFTAVASPNVKVHDDADDYDDDDYDDDDYDDDDYDDDEDDDDEDDCDDDGNDELSLMMMKMMMLMIMTRFGKRAVLLTDREPAVLRIEDVRLSRL